MQNNVTGNTDGLQIFLSNNNTISDNSIKQNRGYGISVFNSTGNNIYHNSLINNTTPTVNLDSTNLWDIGYPGGGNFWSDYVGVDAYWGPNQDQPGSDGIGDTPYTIDSQNQDHYPLIVSLRIHDLAVESVTLPSNDLYVGWIFNTTVTVKNNGGYVESFNVTLYCNGNVVQRRLVGNLTASQNLSVGITWNTSSLAPCQAYYVKAEVSPVLGESHTSDNVYDSGFVKIKMVGDVNGDGRVNTLDIAAVATAFGSRVGESSYRLNYDMNLDYVANIVDISMAARSYGKSCL
jgi:parallel beta-helix repeat protein